MTASAPSREYVYGGSALLAKIDSSGTRYYLTDHLSARLITDVNGNSLGQQNHFPLRRILSCTRHVPWLGVFAVFLYFVVS